MRTRGATSARQIRTGASGAARVTVSKRYYFLSRPRRFGKSLFLDTLKELFEGRRLYVHEHWIWSNRHPVVRLSFGGRHFGAPDDLDANLAAQFDDIEVQAGVSPGIQGRSPLAICVGTSTIFCTDVSMNAVRDDFVVGDDEVLVTL